MSSSMPTGERVRAQTWEQYVGQTKLKDRLLTHIGAARAEGRLLDHMLLVAPPGAGKTTLARLIADSLGDEFHMYMMPVDPKVFCRFCSLWRGGVLLLDEIHAAPKKFQEMLLTALEDGVLHPSVGLPIDVSHITFLAATTEPQGVIKPLWDRFLVKPRWDPYSDADMEAIVAGMAERAGIDVAPEVAAGLARATGGTPRVAGSLVVACRDLAVTGREVTVDATLNLVGVDCDGLSERHIDYLLALYNLGGTSGLRVLCTMLQLSNAVVEDLERLLLRRQLIRLESTGRTLTPAGVLKVPGRNERPSISERRPAS